MPGLQDLARRGAKVIVISHFGRPKGGPDPQFSLKPVADKLGELLGRPVAFAADCIGEAAAKVVAALQPGEIAVLENLRFHKGEEKNDPAFAKALAKLGDIFVGDAFSTAHRAHASTEAITRLLPSYAGPLLMEEINALRERAGEAGAPGGGRDRRRQGVDQDRRAHQSRRQGRQADHRRRHGQHVLAGAGRARSASRWPSPTSPRPRSRSCTPPRRAAARWCCRTMWWWRPSSRRARPRASCPVLEAPADQMILDVGPKAVAHYTDVLGRCRTLLWNGPLGAFEIAPFGEGTFALARAAAAAHQGRQAHLGGRRRRHGGRAQCGRRDRRVHLCLDRGRRLPRMAGGPRAAGHRRARARLTGPGPRRLASDQLHLELPAHDVRGSKSACQA